MNNTKFAAVAFAAASVLAVHSVSADGQSPNRASGASGMGVSGIAAITPNLHLRVEIPNPRYDVNAANALADQTDYELNSSAQSLSVMADWHPFGTGFRFSAGMLNDFDGEGGQSQTTELRRESNGVPDAASLATYVEPDSNPYVGLGWASTFGGNRSLGLNFDLGVMLDDARFDENGELKLRSTESAPLQEYEYLPVFSLGLSYYF
ncbi:MAG: hypothetical protein ACR2RB_12345 [Gammaproteobacteria bacterium]